jgi:putative Mg2+ transporter-C (MgtC) family protein
VEAFPSFREIVGTLRLDLLFKLVMAVLLGGAIGLQREIAGKPAGLRTNILICMGAAMLMDLSIRLSVGPDGERVGDPARLAAQVITGVGFLGAGTILHARGTVIGLTSAATIWMVTALGLTVGAGQYVEAVGAGILVGFVLSGLGRLEYHIRRVRRTVGATVRARPGFTIEELTRVLHTHGIHVERSKVYDHPEDRTFELRLTGPARQYEIATNALLERVEVLSVHVS